MPIVSRTHPAASGPDASPHAPHGLARARQAFRIVAIVLLLAACCLQAGPDAAARNFIWKATSPQGGAIYLVGSVHLLSSAYYPLDPAFTTAFEQADLLVEEIDLGDMAAPASQLMVLQRGMLPSNQSLRTVLTADTYAAVSRKVADLGLPLEPLERFKPWSLALTLEGLEWQKAGFDADLGLDRHFYDTAVASRKPVQALETLEFQIAQFDGMPMDEQDRLLAETLQEMETTKASFTTLADAWKAGDAAGVEAVVLHDLKSEPQMYQRLLVDRNRTWLPKIEALFTRPRPAFVVVGAAHLVGSDGLLEMLRSKGYTIEQL